MKKSKYLTSKKNKMFIITKNCQDYRINRGITQQQIANNIGCSIETISSFENNRNNNALILIWYIEHGITLNELLRGVKNDN